MIWAAAARIMGEMETKLPNMGQEDWDDFVRGLICLTERGDLRWKQFGGDHLPYVTFHTEGLNSVEIDIKDEHGPLEGIIYPWWAHFRSPLLKDLVSVARRCDMIPENGKIVYSDLRPLFQPDQAGPEDVVRTISLLGQPAKEPLVEGEFEW